MATRVFGYRYSGYWVIALFLFAMSIVFGFGAHYFPSSSPKVDGATSNEPFVQWIGSSLGAALSLVGVFLVLKSRNHRVELEGEELRSFDALGRRIATIKSNEVQRVSGSKRETSFEIQAEHDFITVDYGMHESATLRLIAEDAKDGFANWRDRYRNQPPSNYRLKIRQYSYRNGPILFFCVAWNAFLAAFVLLSLPTVMRGVSALTFLMLILFMLPFVGTGIGLMLAVLNQRIEVTDSEIVWIDMLKRTRVVARHDDIIKVDIKEDGSDAYHETMRIITLNGTVSVPSSTRNYYALKSDIQNYIAARQRTEPYIL